MPHSNAIVLPVRDLRVGMFIQLDLSWMRHPFPFGSFRISSQAQIRVLEGLGIEAVRCILQKSDPEVVEQWQQTQEDQKGCVEVSESEPVSIIPTNPDSLPLDSQGAESLSLLAEGHASSPGATHAFAASSVAGNEVSEATPSSPQTLQQRLAHCDQQYLAATQHYEELVSAVPDSPWEARKVSEALVGGALEVLEGEGDALISLLSDGVGERSGQHPVNVMVLCMLLGRALGWSSDTLRDVGLAALLHDIGMLRWEGKLSADLHAGDLQGHVGASVALVQAMNLSSDALSAIAQHHERADGTGYPLCLLNEDLSQGGRVVALVNHYDRLCNPTAVGRAALTPHEALSTIFSQHKRFFDPVVLSAFVRMMGVYPPGSVVELTDGRYGIVTSVNASRPLRPEVQVYQSEEAVGHQVVALDWESAQGVGIRRSLRPAQLPLGALQALTPRARVCYYFERAIALGAERADA